MQPGICHTATFNKSALLQILRVSNIFLILTLVLSGCARRARPDEATKLSPGAQLRADLEQIFSSSEFSNAFWGVVVQSLQTGEIVYEKNSQKLFVPASNMKIITAAAALHYLGPEFSFETIIAIDGPIIDGVVEGNLVIIGGGDPTISGRHYNADTTLLFRQWAEQLKAMGIHQINGDVIGEDSFFQDDRLGPGWMWDDLSYKYAAEVSALQFNENTFTVTVTVNGIKSMDPPTSFITISNQLQPAMPGETKTVQWLRKDNTVFVKGRLQSGEEDYGTFAVSNPAAYFATVLKDVLQSNGIAISGSAYRARDGKYTAPPNLRHLLLHRSPPLSQIVKTMLTVSQNLYAETALKMIGKVVKNEGSFQAGAQALGEMLMALRIKPQFFVIADGSGLSRYNFLAPQSLTQVLRWIHTSSHWNVFYDALPAAGVAGTIANRMKGTAAEKNAHAKTGTLSFVRSLCGYITTADGELMAFAMVVNNFSAPKQSAESIQDAALHKLASFSRRR